MNKILTIFNTDGVNRHRMLFPLAELMGSLERHLKECQSRGLPAGMPSNISHDLCRPIGWARPSGVYIAKDLARQVGVINCWTTTEERDQMGELLQKYWMAYHYYGVQPYLSELEKRLENHLTAESGYCFVEGAAIGRTNLAKDMYPELFEIGGSFVDKDGLTDYNVLLQRTKQIQPGVFHETTQNLVIFAHRFFRRSLSHRNSLNQYVLQSFHRAAIAGAAKPRLRLDPNLLGHPDSVRSVIELEHWHGPHFDDDISKIKSGVTEKVSNEESRFYSAVSKTHAWWKNPEERQPENLPPRMVRTFEIEELVEDTTPGLPNNTFGCRYAHAEYDLQQAVISHFDGAIRAYDADAYLVRIEKSIDRSGKNADYTKLFRLDGSIPVSTWKSVLTDFFRGNDLIEEYLGGTEKAGQEKSDPQEAAEIPVLPALSSYVGLALTDESAVAGRHVLTDLSFNDENACFSFAEVGRGQIENLMRSWCASTDIRLLSAQSTTINLSTIVLAQDQPLVVEWTQVACALADAIYLEVEAGRLCKISVSVRWVVEGIETTLSIAGAAEMVAQLLNGSCGIVRPDKKISEWIELFRDKLCQFAPNLISSVDWPPSTVRHGRISLELEPDITFTERR
ncbi:hypothetical protein [Methylobacterium sp. Leaf112]|uniref:hypothetical protein n=1 Tax=Methylobacterium sp. Leaf112 TaxID=1736258 RepID=UPI000AD90198|nr:hypothetical protein [Methylobacterium sp. Leaf112]